MAPLPGNQIGPFGRALGSGPEYVDGRRVWSVVTSCRFVLDIIIEVDVLDIIIERRVQPVLHSHQVAGW